MGQRVHPHLIREMQPFVDRSLSVSFLGTSAAARYTIEDWQIRNEALKIFEEHLFTNIYIERISSNILFIFISTYSSNMLIGEDSVLLNKYKNKIKKMLPRYTIEFGIINGVNRETDVTQICKDIAHAITSTNGKNYMRTVRMKAENVGKYGLLGISVIISGRINGGTIASNQQVKLGTIQAQSIKCDITKAVGYGMTATGKMGVRVIISRESIKKSSLGDFPTNKPARKPFNHGDNKSFHKKSQPGSYNNRGKYNAANTKPGFNKPYTKQNFNQSVGGNKNV